MCWRWLFVVGSGLFRSGIAYAVGAWLMHVAPTSEARLLVLLMIVLAVLSAFMIPTGPVAIFIPIAPLWQPRLTLARHAR
ncbi:MAG: SLC13 family permease [Gammaproteobacteria bacterium]